MADLPGTELAHSARQARVRIINYGSEFEDLWSRVLDTDEAPFGDVTDLVVLWEGDVRADPSDAMLSPHLTPLDWALLYSIRACDESGRGDLSIHIVDLTGAQFREAYAIRQRHQWLAEMPWVGLYGALSPTDLPGIRYRRGYRPLHSNADATASLLRPRKDDGGGLEFNAGHDLDRMPQTKDVRQRERLTELLVAWAASLPNTRDHHDLNNIVGPAILTGSAEGEVSYAMVKKITALPWWEAGAEDLQSKGLFPWTQSAQWFDRKLSVLVVDDDVHQGWGQFVQQVFGDVDPARASIRLLDNAEELLTFLEASAVYDRRDYCASVCSQDANLPVTPEIVFLDLRLTQDEDALRRQTLRLLQVADRFEAIDSPAWEYINPDDLLQVRAWYEERFVGDPSLVKDKARLLLPMVLSLALPLTPIVLFSSTGQPWIKARLKPYQNILTGFEKPRILAGYEAIASAINALRDALMYTAIPMLRLRLQLAHAQAAVRIAAAARVAASKVAGSHIEIYADETVPAKGGWIVSGVVVAGFDDVGAADRLQKELEYEFAKSSGRRVWAGLRRRGGPLAGEFGKGKDIKSKRGKAKAQVTELKGILDYAKCRNGSSWSVVATGGKLAQISLPVRPTLKDFPDSVLDEALRFNIEFTLFAFLPYVTTGHGRRSVAIHLPTRVLPVAAESTRARLDANASVQRSLGLCDAFQVRATGMGNDIDGWTWGVFTYDAAGEGSMEWNNVFPLVRAWLAAWPNLFRTKRSFDIVAVRAAKLGRAERQGISKDDASRRRLIHDIADWACSAATTGGEILRDVLSDSDVIQNWILPDDAESFMHTSRRLMSALRAAEVDRPSESRDALQLILRAGRVSTCDDALLNSPNASAQRLLLWALRETLERASGETLLSMLAIAEAGPDSE